MQDQSNEARRVLQSSNDRMKALATEVSKFITCCCRMFFRAISAFLPACNVAFFGEIT